jgi:predicted HicB family RNase H-like nuclease
MVDTLTATKKRNTEEAVGLVRTTIRLPLRLHRAAKIAAASAVTSFQDLVIEAIESHLTRKK